MQYHFDTCLVPIHKRYVTGVVLPSAISVSERLVFIWQNYVNFSPSVSRSLLGTLRFPLVFVVSESQHGLASPSRLFPSSVTSALGICTIRCSVDNSHMCRNSVYTVFLCSFNPVAQTSLTKTLHRIASVECRRPSSERRGRPCYQLPSRDIIETVALSSAGDIRSAINALQFACLGGERELRR